MKNWLGALVLAPALIGAAGAAAADDISGVWRLSSGKVTVQIAPCGGAQYCGHVVALAKPNYDNGTPKVDRKNPNPALRKRPVIGLTILYDMRRTGQGTYRGMIYNADDGHTYTAYLADHGQRATMKACVTILCKSMTWIKVN